MFRRRTYLKILLSTLVALFVNFRASEYISFFQHDETVRVRGPLYGTCAPIEQLQDLNDEINPILTQLSVSKVTFPARVISAQLITSHLSFSLSTYRARRSFRRSKSIWRKNARSGPSNVCVTRTSAPFASVTTEKYRCSGKSSGRKTKARCERRATATSWTSHE